MRLARAICEKAKFELKFAPPQSVIERSKMGYHRRDTFHRRGDCRGGFYYLGAFWGVAWLVLNALCLSPFFVRCFLWLTRR